MIKIKKNWKGENVPVILFRQAQITMTLANGNSLGTVQTLSFQENAPSKSQWLEQVRKAWDVKDISFRDLGVQSCEAPQGHPAWKLV